MKQITPIRMIISQTQMNDTVPLPFVCINVKMALIPSSHKTGKFINLVFVTKCVGHNRKPQLLKTLPVILKCKQIT